MKTSASTLAFLLSSLVVPALAGANALDHLKTTDDIGRNKIPHLGTSHILVVPTRVGTPVFPATHLAQLRAFYDPAGGPGTFRRYWQVVSQGKWDPIPTLVEPVMYVGSCPIPGRTAQNCRLTISDVDLIGQRGVGAAVENILGRVRDEQNVDLTTFDVNSASGAGPDGYFDGLIFDTDIYSGIGFPLAALGNEAIVDARPGGPRLSAGNVALVPPDLHEFGHLLGFIDLYNGPAVNCLMSDIASTLSAFSRQQIGWGEVRRITGDLEIDLKPVLASGPVLRIGEAPRYIMVENRAGPDHVMLDQSVPGVYVYSIDEDRLPSGPLGFLDLAAQNLYFPNSGAGPYLNVNLPVGCSLFRPTDANRCALGEGATRKLIHASGEDSGFTLTVGASQADGTVHISLQTAADDNDNDNDGDKDGGGCVVGHQRDGAWIFLALAALAMTRRRYHRR